MEKPDKKEEQRNKRLYKSYGVTPEYFKDLFTSQDGLCAICQDRRLSERLCVDHIHQLGFKKMLPEEKIKYVRGLLCYMCNVGIKGFDKTKDGEVNRNRLDGTYKYFSKYKLKGELK